MVRIALGQLNTTVGDLTGNVERMTAWAAGANDAGADLICFPELAITGYPPEDLVLRPEFVRDNLSALESLAAATANGCRVFTGFVDRTERGLHNAAALLSGGAVEARYRKCQLPNYGVFDEQRYFTPGTAGKRVTLDGLQVGLSVCEDAWHAGPPFDGYAGLDLVLNINGSPYHRGKAHEREDVLRDRARQTGAWILYVNAVGGQDELVFDGGSLVMAPAGEVVARLPLFEEDLMMVDIEVGSDGRIAGAAADRNEPWVTGPEEVYRALVLGTQDYAHKNGFREVVLGLSGGIDSALVATIAADAFGPDGVRVLAMPSPYSSPESVEDAEDCAARLGIRLDLVPIEEMFAAYRRVLGPLGAGEGLAAENLQARIRGTTVMAISNASGSMALVTGNKSEYAVGYATLYGDMAGSYAPIKDVPKTLVYELAAWRNAHTPEDPPIPERTITKPPSAELRPGQLDTDSLPPYDVLDPIVEAYVEDDLSADEIVERGISDAETVKRIVQLIDHAEYKRRQSAPGVKITPKAFGRDRRVPIVNRYPG
jgi:NAD+ synthase (glutamine-hydrolysing)